MSEISILMDKENQLLNRREIRFKVIHNQTPSRREIRDKLSAELGLDRDLTVVESMKTAFGKGETVGFAKAYESENRMKEIESKHVLKRNEIIL